MTEIRAGYKQTEVGAIPEDWQIKRIGDFTDCTAGGTPSTFVKSFWGGNIRWMNSGELNLKIVSEVDGRITEDGLRNSSTKEIPPYCVLVGLAGQGKTRGTVAINTVGLCTNQSIAAIFPNDTFEPKYLFYNLENRYLELRNLSTGEGGRGGLNLTIIRNMPVPLPPLAEQRAIAAALSDVDGLLTALAELIAKKRAIKQAAMQQLLTGQTRLPGFNSGWHKKKLGELTEIRKGQVITESQVSLGDIPVIAGGMAPSYYHSVNNRPANTITISASGANAGYVAFHTTPIFASDCTTITEQASFNIKFLFYALLNKQKDITALQAGGAQPHVYAKQLETLEIDLPEYVEQCAISEILSEMDAEISALEAQRAKVQALKQGMLQELLTGRTRLV